MSVGANILGAIVNGVPRGKGYEVYGGSYYGTPEMRRSTAISPIRATVNDIPTPDVQQEQQGQQDV